MYFYIGLSIFIYLSIFTDALYRYLKNKNANNGLHFGGSAGFGFGGAGSKLSALGGLPASIQAALSSGGPVYETGKATILEKLHSNWDNPLQIIPPPPAFLYFF